MEADDDKYIAYTPDEYIAYRPDDYIQLNGDNLKVEDDEELDNYQKALSNLKWNQLMDKYNSLATSDISFKRVKRDYEDETDPLEKNLGEGDEKSIGRVDDGGGAEESDIKLCMTPVYALTALFGAIFIFGPIFVRKGPNKGIVQSSIMLAAFCMWIFWVTVYIGQMNPLMGPRLENTTVAWMAFKLGNPVKPAATTPDTPPNNTRSDSSSNAGRRGNDGGGVDASGGSDAGGGGDTSGGSDASGGGYASGGSDAGSDGDDAGGGGNALW